MKRLNDVLAELEKNKRIATEANLLNEAAGDIWLVSLYRALDKNKNKPEFEKVFREMSEWGSTYPLSVKKLKKQNDVGGKLFTKVVDGLDVFFEWEDDTY
jgi:hypothetical protein